MSTPWLGSMTRRPIMGLVLAALLVGAAATTVDLRAVGRHLLEARPGWLGLAVVLHGFSLWARLERWQGLLAAAGIRARMADLAGPCALGWLLNAVVPGRTGELGRPLLALGPGERTVGLGTVGAERVLDVCVLGAMLVAGLLTLGTNTGAGGRWWWGAALALGAMPAGVLVLRQGGFDSVLGPLAVVRVRLAQGTEAMASPRSFLRAAGASALVWALEVGMALACFRAFGLPVPPGLATLWVAATTLALAAPLGLGNAGLNGWIALLAFAGEELPGEPLLAASLAQDALALAVVAGLAIGFGGRLGRRQE
jgi:uncharacterized membrane protein YbhN (UPF0104 family)